MCHWRHWTSGISQYKPIVSLYNLYILFLTQRQMASCFFTLLGGCWCHWLTDTTSNQDQKRDIFWGLWLVTGNNSPLLKDSRGQVCLWGIYKDYKHLNINNNRLTSLNWLVSTYQSIYESSNFKMNKLKFILRIFSLILLLLILLRKYPKLQTVVGSEFWVKYDEFRRHIFINLPWESF